MTDYLHYEAFSHMGFLPLVLNCLNLNDVSMLYFKRMILILSLV